MFSAFVAVTVMAHDGDKKSSKKACCQSKEACTKKTADATPTTTEQSHAGCNHAHGATSTETGSAPAAKQCSGAASTGKPCCASKAASEQK